MKTVRVWFEKKDTARYISHLDLNRCMSRAFHKTKLPLWYTQGFHPHVFLTITMPLSLGMIGLRESMDIRLTEEMAGEEIIRRLNTALPLDIHVFDVTEPVMKAKDVPGLPMRLSTGRKTAPPRRLWPSCRSFCPGKRYWYPSTPKRGPRSLTSGPISRTSP